jgi:chondroitin AC lyase
LRRLPFLLVAVLLATAARAADIDVVRANFIAYYTGAGADVTAPRMHDALAGLENEARTYIAPGYLRGDGSWSDLDYTQTPSGTWSPWEHTKRLIVMAKAYRTPGQSLYRDPALRTEIEAALSYTQVYYGTSKLPNGNWWFWTLGVPLDLGPTLVLMRDDISPATYNACVSSISLRIGSSPTSRGIVGPVPVGENLVWSSFTHLSLALLKDDPKMLAAVSNAMASVTVASAVDEGIKPDRSFQQHGAQLYTGGYGGSFANNVAEYTLLTRGTSLTLPPASLASFNDYIADGVAWSLYGNYFDASVVGREVVRPSTSGFNGLAALLQASTVAGPRQNEIRAAAAMMLKTWGGLPIELAGLATTVERSGIAPAWPSGQRHYWESDYTIHRRPGWFSSIRMFSKRTKSGESTNDENLLGSRESDGRFYLVLDGNEYFGRDVLPALDWSRLPGTTVEQKADAADDTFGYGTSAFAGGADDGTNGASAMILQPLNSVLTARKAWFFFDDVIVFLTNSVTQPSANHAETIVNQWPLLDASSQVVTDGASQNATTWALLERVGYYFPTPAALQIKREHRTGTWAALGGSADTTPKSADVVTMWLDHGTMVTNGSAEYMVIPNATESTMRSFAASRPVTVLANNDNVAAARDARTNALAATFFTSGSAIEGYSTDAPAIVYAVDTPTTRLLHVADPLANATGVIHVTVPGVWTTAEARITSVSASATTVEIPKSSGRTVHVTLHPASLLRRAVRH